MVLNRRWNYLAWTDEQREAILAKYDRTGETVRDDIDIIKKWWSQQPHLPSLPEVITDDLIEFFLIFNKFRMEMVKQRLDMYLSLRTAMPDYFYVKDVALANDLFYYVLFKQLTPSNQRVLLMKLKNVRPASELDPRVLFAYAMNVAEVRLRIDKTLTDIYIIDFENATFEHTVKFTPTFVKSAFTVLDKVYSSRFESFYMINAPKFVDGLVTLIKSVIREKLRNKIKSCPDANVLFELLPRSVIPRDYGGDGESMDELNEIFAKKTGEIGYVIETIKANPVNEQLRPGKPLDVDALHGTEGTFRKLQID